MALVQDFEKVDDGDAIFLSTPMKITIGIFVVGPTLALLGVDDEGVGAPNNNVHTVLLMIISSWRPCFPQAQRILWSAS